MFAAVRHEDLVLSGDGQMVARVSGRDVPQKGATLFFTTRAERIHLFDRTTGERIES